MRTALACAVAAGAAIAGCGGSSGGTPLAVQDSATLHRDIGAIRTAASANNPTGAEAAAARLRADVERMRGEGRLSAADSQSILVGVARVASRIAAEVHPPVAPIDTTTQPAAGPAPKASPGPAHAKPPGPAHGKGPGHDHGPKGGKDGGD